MEKDITKLKSNELEYSNPVIGEISLIPVAKRYGVQNYIVYRVKLPSIEVTKETRDGLLELMNKGRLYAQVGDHTVMINSIAAIDPMDIALAPKSHEPRYVNYDNEMTQDEFDKASKTFARMRGMFRHRT